MEPFFSVIVPAYNAEKSIERCIDSIENQGFEFYEIIVVNDGSTDHLENVVRKRAKYNERIVIINKSNGGVASARNFGIKLSRGKFVIFLDSDDILYPDAFSNLHKAISVKQDYDMFVCDTYSFENIKDGSVTINKMFNNVNYDKLSFKETKILCQNLSSMCIGVYNRDFLLNNQLYVKDGITVGEDTDFIFRCILRCDKISLVACNLFLYYYNSESVMNNLKPKNISDLLSVCVERTKDLLELHPSDIDFEKAMSFFAGKFIHFGIKVASLDKADKRKLFKYMKENRYILKYANTSADKLYCRFVKLFGERISCFIFYNLVKFRNNFSR